MSKIGYIFPGQGSQYIGMGLDLYEKYQAARDIFDTANSVLGFDLKNICFEGPKEELVRTDISQPAIVTVSIAALRVLQENFNNKGILQYAPVVSAGLSLGEYSALVAAGVITFDEAVKLVNKRGQFMQEAADRNKGTMACVMGLSKEALENICKNTNVQIANLNCPGQIVISGLTDDINKTAELARTEGASRVIVLDVSGPFHSIYMRDAANRLEKEFESVRFSSPKFPIVANVTAGYETSIEDIKKNLLFQVSGSVLWEDSVRLMVKDGVTTFMEIGPGTVLKGLARRIDSNIKVYNIGKAQEIEEFVGGCQNVA